MQTKTTFLLKEKINKIVRSVLKEEWGTHIIDPYMTNNEKAMQDMENKHTAIMYVIDTAETFVRFGNLMEQILTRIYKEFYPARYTTPELNALIKRWNDVYGGRYILVNRNVNGTEINQSGSRTPLPDLIILDKHSPMGKNIINPVNIPNYLEQLDDQKLQKGFECVYEMWNVKNEFVQKPKQPTPIPYPKLNRRK